ncbi:tyrosine-type recombinase/integrase [Deinococcus yunweiensis]|uniref:tyrosine-type recombinase/integrase n=1 Tax=Deinococcus yunweiensis TaxID=367282 RepID=UPI00398E4636
MAKGTSMSYRNALNQFLRYAESAAPNLLRPELEMGPAYVRALEARGLKPASVKSLLCGARMLYRALRWTGATTADPFVDTRAPRDTTAPWDKRQPYSEEDVSALLEVAPLRDQVLILLCAHGGLRISEALALAWDDVEEGVVIVQRGKGGKRRRVDCSRRLSEALQRYREVHPAATTNGLVVGGEYSTACDRLAGLAQRAGVTYRAFHSFRHHAGTKLYRQTGRLEDAARHLGHSTIETTRIYAKWADDTVKKAVQDW